MQRRHFLTSMPALLSTPLWAEKADVSFSNLKSAVSRSELLLSGPDWKLGSFPMGEGEGRKAFLPNFDEDGFRTVTVPGEIQLQLGLRGMDRYYQSRELTLVNEKEWWYRKRFVVPKDDAGKLNRLVFEGVDYFTTIWLNGDKLGKHEGCYIPFEFDVSSELHYGGENVLALKVTCPWVPKGGRGFLEYLKGEWTMGDPSSTMQFPFPPYVLGPRWDGIPAAGNAVFPMGLWRDVRLVTSSFVRVDDVFISTKTLNSDGSATLAISGTIENRSDQDVAIALELEITPDNFAGDSLFLPRQSLKAHPGKNSFSAEVVVQHPQLWWTWDTGKQDLYKLVTAISSEDGGDADRREAVFGVRTIERKDDMSYWLNGKRVFLKGAWYPMADYYGSLPTRVTYEQDLELFKAANLNHLVAFTVVEKPDFYDLCDRLGILIIFEFPFGQFGPEQVLDPSNPRREVFIKESLSQLRQIVIQLRNHPSIIEWAAFAEAHEKGGHWGVGGLDFDKYGYGEYSDSIGKLVSELDPGTIYHPSLCDLGEEHFWIANAGMGTEGGYNQQFDANTGFVSEYGSIALPSLRSLKKMLSPEEMWSGHEQRLPEWHNLPVDINAYAYQSSFEYDGIASVLERFHQFVDRSIQSAQQLVDASQLYQAFLFKYATEAYRRKKYHSINGVRIWAYGEATPGIRFSFVDYFRVPKMGYYYLKHAQERFAVNFAYEQALESQVSGKRLQIPVWLINDYRRSVAVELHCEIRTLQGHVVLEKDFSGAIGSDESKEMGVVDWVTPEISGIYVLSARASEEGGPLRTSDSTFIKVTPKLFSRLVRVLVIGQREYSLPVVAMLHGMGLAVDVIEEEHFPQLGALRDAEALRKKYDVIWLTSFDSLWKLLSKDDAEGLKEAVSQGVGFIHTGGPGSFHGGFGRAACLDFTPLAEILPVELRKRNDLVFGQIRSLSAELFQNFGALKNIQVVTGGAGQWGDEGLRQYGVAGFNDVELKPGSKEILSISGRPLLTTGQYGQGRTVVFTGSTPSFGEKRAYWDRKITFPYLVDQEFYTQPANQAYFVLFGRMIVEAAGEKPVADPQKILAARNKPLFEMLKDMSPASLDLPEVLTARSAGQKARAILTLRNGSEYARLVRMRVEWNRPESEAPYLTVFEDNYFDLMPGEEKGISLTMFLSEAPRGAIQGTLVVEGANVPERHTPIEIQPA